jgi:hypothetical protein
VLLLFEFASFAVGAYFVYDHPVSNVAAETNYSGSNAFLNLSASQLANDTSRIIWIDPSIAYDAAGNAYANTNSGFVIANVTTSSDGTVSGNFEITPAMLQQIENDGQEVHAVWVAGVGQNALPGSPQYLSLTSDSEQNYTSATRGSGVTLFVTLITVDVPVTFNLGQLFIVLWTIYIVLFAIALNGPFKSLLGSIRSASTRGIEALMDNAMFATLLVFPVVLWGTVALSLIQEAVGVSTGSLPTIDPLLEFVELAIAPFREEIGFRVIPIGVAALIVIAAKGRVRDGLLALWHPSRYLKKSDTPEQYKRHLRLIYAMIAVSAVLFGLAHVLLGAGWGPGKIASAAVAGVALGGLYYVYGLPSAILLHWSIDYFLSVFGFNNQILANVGNFISIYTLFLAVVSSIVLVVLLIRKLRKSEIGVLHQDWGSSVE